MRHLASDAYGLTRGRKPVKQASGAGRPRVSILRRAEPAAAAQSMSRIAATISGAPMTMGNSVLARRSARSASLSSVPLV